MNAPIPRAPLEGWLRRQSGFERAVVTSIALAEGGVSNLTCRVEVTQSPINAICVRVQRADGIFAPYDVLHEAAVLDALAHTEIPVPRMIGAERSPAVLGAPFAVMEWIDAPHMGVAGPEASMDAFVEMVTRIHRVPLDLVAPPLSRPASVRDALAGELRDIEVRLDRTSGDESLAPALVTLHATIPIDGELALCQGDINVFNYLFRDGEVAGVVDWERARISDLRSDIGHLVALSHLKGLPWCDADDAPFVRAYGHAAATPVRGMAWFRARWLVDLAVIHSSARALGLPPLWFTQAEVWALLERAQAELKA